MVVRRVFAIILFRSGAFGSSFPKHLLNSHPEIVRRQNVDFCDQRRFI